MGSGALCVIWSYPKAYVQNGAKMRVWITNVNTPSLFFLIGADYGLIQCRSPSDKVVCTWYPGKSCEFLSGIFQNSRVSRGDLVPGQKSVGNKRNVQHLTFGAPQTPRKTSKPQPHSQILTMSIESLFLSCPGLVIWFGAKLCSRLKIGIMIEIGCSKK